MGPRRTPPCRAARPPASSRLELRDGGERYGGKGVRNAVKAVNDTIDESSSATRRPTSG